MNLDDLFNDNIPLNPEKNPPYRPPEPVSTEKGGSNPPESVKTYVSIARQALDKLEPDAGIRAKVWAEAVREERNWAFLVREHGYPAGWFVFGHVDTWLRQHHHQGIALETVQIEESIAAWWIVPDAGTPPASPLPGPKE